MAINSVFTHTQLVLLSVTVTTVLLSVASICVQAQHQHLSADIETYSQQNQQQEIQKQQTHARLPNINFFVNPNENYKLLGINATIPYITNGEINDYALNFIVPLGYNQSDMIFNWQNLGATNVNYSISLVITNIRAVDTPLINITRTGLIPHHEQVFKIRLPCSGKESAEADVQVLVSITEQLALSSSSLADALASNSSSAATAADDSKRQLNAAAAAFEHKLVIRRRKICLRDPVLVNGPTHSAPASASMQQPPASMLRRPPNAFAASASVNVGGGGGEQHQFAADYSAQRQQQQQQLSAVDKTFGKSKVADTNLDGDGDANYLRRATLDAPTAHSFDAPPPTINNNNWHGGNLQQHQQQSSSSADANKDATIERIISKLSIKQTAAAAAASQNFFQPSNSLSRATNFSASAPTVAQHLLPLNLQTLLIIVIIALIFLALLSSALSSSSTSTSSSSSASTSTNSSNYGAPTAYEHTYKGAFDRLGTLCSVLFNCVPKANNCKPPTMTGTVISSAFRANAKPTINSSTLSALSLHNNFGGKESHHQIGNNIFATTNHKAAPKQPSSYFYKTHCQAPSVEPYYQTSVTNNTYQHSTGSYQALNYATNQHQTTGDLLGTNYFTSPYAQSMQPSMQQQQQQQQQQQHLHMQQQHQQQKQTPNNSVASSSASGNSGNYPINHPNSAIANGNQTTRLIWTNGNGTTTQDGYTVDASYMPVSQHSARSETGSVYQTIY